MADFGPIPNDFWEDRRLRRVDPAARFVACGILSVCCPRGRFGEVDDLLRAFGVPPQFSWWVEAQLIELESAGWLRWYGSTEFGLAVRGGEVVDYSSYKGLPDTRRFESKVKGHKWPEPDGTLAPVRERFETTSAVLHSFFRSSSAVLPQFFRTSSDADAAAALRGTTAAASAHTTGASQRNIEHCDRTSAGLPRDFRGTSATLALRGEERERREEEEPDAPARVPIYERPEEPARQEQEAPQRGYATSAHALNEGQGEAQRSKAAELPAGAIAVPKYENPAPRGMGGRVSARYDGTDRANDRYGGWPTPRYEPASEYGPDPEGDALAERRRAALAGDRAAQRFGYPNKAALMAAIEESVAKVKPLEQLPEPTEEELMERWKRQREAAKRMEEEEDAAALGEDPEDDGTPIVGLTAQEAGVQYLRALEGGELP